MQRSLDDLGTPLSDVTFCVIDLETTGGSADRDEITEVGIALYRGGECLNTFSTLVNPGTCIPPTITLLTGITESMVGPAPSIESQLGAVLDLIGSAVIVGHNISFDVRFLNRALVRAGREPLRNPTVDTCALARRLLADEVPNHKLSTLAGHLRLPHQPSHRALDDVLATADLLHVLLERSSAWGVTGLEDLLSLPSMANHPESSKLRLTADLPRSTGVYRFVDDAGTVLYVGKATNLRSRVRSYFSTDSRRKISQLLRETRTIEHDRCDHLLEAEVMELRQIAHHQPRFNRQGRSRGGVVYLKLTNETWPRLSIVRSVRDDGGSYLGPLPSRRVAQACAEAIWTSVPIRRCAATPGRHGGAACTSAQLGVAACPCTGDLSPLDYQRLVTTVVRGLSVEPELLLAPLRTEMERLAGLERFEQAADVRDRAAALSDALARQRNNDVLRKAGRIVITFDDGSGAVVEDGRFNASWSNRGGDPSQGALFEPSELATSRLASGAALNSTALNSTVLNSAASTRTVDGGRAGDTPPLFRPLLDQPGALDLSAPIDGPTSTEITCIARFLQRHAGRVTLVHADAGLVSPLPRPVSFRPRPEPGNPKTENPRGRGRSRRSRPSVRAAEFLRAG